MNKLASYLKHTGTKQADFARMVGATQATISKLTKTAKPSLSLAIVIEQATNGEVPAASWLEDAR